MIGAIEAGGTKIICAVGRSWHEIRDAEKLVVPTTSPNETMATVMDWFVSRHRVTPLAAIGVASFGPVDFSTTSIADSTPKKAWRGVNWHGSIKSRIDNVAVGFDTDTNAAGVAEWRWGNAKGRRIAVYVTVGTGIGGALIVNGEPIHGLLHPELGHMLVPRRRDDQFLGACPFHVDCLEGLASGAAINLRASGAPSPLAPDHPAWDLESDYLARAMINIIMIASPQIIILGGGVMTVAGLLDEVRRKTRALVKGYIDKSELGSDIDSFIVAPGLGSSSGVVGAFALGARAFECST